MNGVFAALAASCKRASLLVTIGLLSQSLAFGRTLEVGPGRELAGVAQAAAAARDGDHILFDPGVYLDCGIFPASHLTIEARHAPATMKRTVMSETIVAGPTCGDRAQFYFVGHDVVVRGISFQHARATSHTGAGILMEGDNLTIDGDSFLDDENGILTGGSPNSVVRVTHSLFRGDGACVGACAHALYAGARIARLEVADCVFGDIHVGHAIKSRARSTVVRDSRIEDGTSGTSSYLIELPDGGDADILNNTLQKGALSENKEAAISIGTETNLNPTRSLRISGNRFTSELPEPVRFVRDMTATPARLSRNTLIGKVIPLEGPGTVE